MSLPREEYRTESDSLESLLNAPVPEGETRGSFLVLAVIAALSDLTERIVSIRGILMVLAIAAIITQNTSHLDVLIGTLGGSLVPQTEKTRKK